MIYRLGGAVSLATTDEQGRARGRRDKHLAALSLSREDGLWEKQALDRTTPMDLHFLVPPRRPRRR